MSRSRSMAAGAGVVMLCACVATGSASAVSPQHRAPVPPPKPVLILNGDTGARPGQLVDIMLDGVGRAQGRQGVTAASPAFRGPARLAKVVGEDSYEADVPLAMTDRPGWYPLSVSVGGHVVARDRIQVVRSRRPSLTVSASASVARPGERVWVSFDDLYPGQTGTAFTVRSTALPKPVRLVHDKIADFYNPRAFSARPVLPPNTKDGTYAFEVYGPHGRIIVKRLTVRAARRGGPDYLGKARGPAFFAPHGSPDDARQRGYRVPAGGHVEVLWHDAYPDAGEEERLVATSPAFTAPVKLRRDDSKGADGDDPRYFNRATIRTGLKPGDYPVTVVAHHGRVKKTGYLTVRSAPAPRRSAVAGPGAGWFGTVGGSLVLAAMGVATAARRRRPAAGR